MDRVAGEVRPTVCRLDLCLAWLIKEARNGLFGWLGPILNASLFTGEVPKTLKEAVI